MGKEDYDDFLLNYHNVLFKENISDNFAKANFIRYHLCQTLAFSSAGQCNESTCRLLDENVRSYMDHVDDLKGINNYADATLELAESLRTDCKQWKSNILKDGPNVSQLLKTLPGKCLNKNSDGSCTSSIPTLDDIASLEKVYRQFTFPEVIQKTEANNSQASVNQSNQQEADIFKSINQFNKCIPKTNSPKCSTSEQMEVENISTEVPSGIYFFNKLGKNSVRKQSKACNNEDNDEEIGEGEKKPLKVDFRTARQQLRIENQKKNGNTFNNETSQCNSGYNPSNVLKKSLGGKRSVSTKFVPPTRINPKEEQTQLTINEGSDGSPSADEDDLYGRLKNIEPKIIDLIKNEIMNAGTKVEWQDIAGLDFAKTIIQEIVVWPMLRPDIFTGLRRPPKGILLFGPPGTGKTLIGKCVASQAKATFFSISASSLTSKWIGEGEKMVRALFAVARVYQPSVIFIDEIDSLLSRRNDTEHESSRRLKTEFLVQLDGAGTGDEDRILVIGATNRPQELDEAARRRLVKRLYIPLPVMEARKQLVMNLMKEEKNNLAPDEIDEIAKLTNGFSGADMKNLCQEASLGPIRTIAASQMFEIKVDQVRPVSIGDFKIALNRVRSSVSPSDLQQYIDWDKQYGLSNVILT